MDLERELGEIGRECSLQLLKNFSKLDILPWYHSGKIADKTTTNVQFIRYDPLNTCFRSLPGAPRFFQGALKAGRLSSQELTELLTRLLAFCRQLLPRYNGHFSAEINGTIGQMVRRAADLQDHGLLEIERDFSPDDLFAAMPWVCRPHKHFATSGFRPIAVPQSLIAAAKQPFTALSVGIDAVGAGPGAGLSFTEIMNVLDLLEGKVGDRQAKPHDQGAANKIALPSITGGFQGLTVANFVNLSDAGQHRVLGHLYQFGETIGRTYEEIRHRHAERILQKHDNIEDVAKAFLTILPPTEHIIVSKGKDMAGLQLRREEDYWVGYSVMPKDQATAISALNDADDFLASVNGDQFRVQVKIVDDLPSLDPVLMRFRMKANMMRITSTLDRTFNMPVLRRNDVRLVVESLERQIADGIRLQAGCKALYLFDAILRNYEHGEIRLHNEGCRKFMEAKLNKPPSGYQVVGKAAGAYLRLARKFIQLGLQFDTPAGAVLRVRWRPLLDAAISSIREPAGSTKPVSIAS
jgi:hypothetical protein